jgi:hypothetical protein
MAHNRINELLQRRMDRKDFLKQLGMGVAMVVGAGWVIKLFRAPETHRTDFGYGGSVYGGRPKLLR